MGQYREGSAKVPMTSTRASIDLKAAIFLTALFVVVWVLWDTPVVYPIKIFVVCLHELGHAVAALLTGGQVVSIQIFPEEGGLTTTRGGWLFVILSAGYLGGMLAGGVLLYLSSHRRWGRVLMIMLAALIALSTLLFFRNFFGVVYGLLAAAAMFFCAYRLPIAANFYVVRFIAIASCLYALLDIRSDLFTFAPAGSGIVKDAVALSRLTGIPSIIWAGLWMVISLVMLVFFLSRSARVRDQD
jgi:hypothetical protein